MEGEGLSHELKSICLPPIDYNITEDEYGLSAGWGQIDRDQFGLQIGYKKVHEDPFPYQLGYEWNSTYDQTYRALGQLLVTSINDRTFHCYVIHIL